MSTAPKIHQPATLPGPVWWHWSRSNRLVRYYRIAGFRAERDVGEDLGSLRDRLTWGAEGTLMVASADDFMRRWTSLMQETSASDEGSEAAAAASAAAAAAVEKLETWPSELG